MRAIAVAIATIALTGCATYSFEDAKSTLAAEDEIRSSCEQQLPNDYRMQEHCLETQTQGYREVQAFVEKHNIHEGSTSPAAMILEMCMTKWGIGHFDWRMVVHCAEKQLPAYRRLHPGE